METEHEKADRNLFNDLMDYVGTEGKFQFRFNYLYNMALMVLVALPALNIVLALSSPDHWCHVPGRSETNLTSLEWKELTVPRYKAFFSTKRECICDIALHVAFLDWYVCMFHSESAGSVNYSVTFRCQTNARLYNSVYSTILLMFIVIVGVTTITILHKSHAFWLQILNLQVIFKLQDKG